MNTVVIDSSGWIEYFTEGPKADDFDPLITDTKNLIVPTIVIFEVYKKFLQISTETEAINVTGQMRKGRVLDFNEYIGIWAAQLSSDFKLPMADSIILASAYATGSTLWTMDKDFQKISGVNYISQL